MESNKSINEFNEEEEECMGQNCRGCGVFVPDGEEYVPEGSPRAFCLCCFEKLTAVEEEKKVTRVRRKLRLPIKNNADEGK